MLDVVLQPGLNPTSKQQVHSDLCVSITRKDIKKPCYKYRVATSGSAECMTTQLKEKKNLNASSLE